eukprot:COSAG04_NODE_515_length_13209_cov_19.059115_13_plen_209_part_00
MVPAARERLQELVEYSEREFVAVDLSSNEGAACARTGRHTRHLPATSRACGRRIDLLHPPQWLYGRQNRAYRRPPRLVAHGLQLTAAASSAWIHPPCSSTHLLLEGINRGGFTEASPGMVIFHLSTRPFLPPWPAGGAILPTAPAPLAAPAPSLRRGGGGSREQLGWEGIAAGAAGPGRGLLLSGGAPGRLSAGCPPVAGRGAQGAGH